MGCAPSKEPLQSVIDPGKHPPQAAGVVAAEVKPRYTKDSVPVVPSTPVASNQLADSVNVVVSVSQSPHAKASSLQPPIGSPDRNSTVATSDADETITVSVINANPNDSIYTINTNTNIVIPKGNDKAVDPYQSDGNGSSGSRGSGNRSSNEISSHSNHSSGNFSTDTGNNKSVKRSTSKIFTNSMADSRRASGDLKSKVVHIEVPFGKPIEEVYDGVHNGPVLGSGISGVVRLVTHIETGIKYAVKCLDLGFIETEKGLQQLREEIYIMCQLDHPNIVRLEEVYESHNEIYLVQELCLGGELFDRLDEQPDYHYTEQQCARLVKQMLCAVRYIHSKGIIHRDLKLENFLFTTTSPTSELKMIDFGLSKHFTTGELQHEAVGTPYTVAPEVINGAYDEKCDIWAIGVITFLLLSGDPPFGGCGGPEPLMAVRSNILSGQFQFEPEEVWWNVSQQAKNFISSLLVSNPQQRPNAVQSQKSAWVQEWANTEKKMQKGDGALNPNVVKALLSFKEYSDMRKLLCEVLSFTLLPHQIQDLRSEFEKLDTEGSGEISLNALKTVLMTEAGAGSLGSLTEEEVEDIFNAMRVRKSETTIQWHEFIAAGLSQCQVDDRNLRLAFDRLDADHKGYISFADVLDLVGNDTTEETLRSMFQDSLRRCKCQSDTITYEDFVLLMKGQTGDGVTPIRPGNHSVSNRTKAALEDFKVPSAVQSNSLVPNILNNSTVLGNSTRRLSLGVVHETSTSADETDIYDNTGVYASKANVPCSHSLVSYEENLGHDDGPLTFDDDEDEIIVGLGGKQVENANDVISGQHQTLNPNSQAVTSNLGLAIQQLSPPASTVEALPSSQSHSSIADDRKRSKSVDDGDSPVQENDNLEEPCDGRSHVCVALPEHDHDNSIVEDLLNDESKTPLVVNRELYRAHRLMRLAVLEASKRFEEKQMTHVEKMLNESSNGEIPVNGANRAVPAGLVMRRGQRRQLSNQSIRQIVKEEQKETNDQLEKMCRRSGRGRRTRTVSDVYGMLHA